MGIGAADGADGDEGGCGLGLCTIGYFTGEGVRSNCLGAWTGDGDGTGYTLSSGLAGVGVNSTLVSGTV